MSQEVIERKEKQNKGCEICVKERQKISKRSKTEKEIEKRKRNREKKKKQK